MNIKQLIYLFLAVMLVSSCSSPKAIFNFDQDDKQAPADVFFLNESVKAESYTWDFGDGNTSTEMDPQHRYVLSGKYTVTLKAIKGGKVDIMTKDIIFDAPEECLLEMETSMGTMTIQLYDDTPKHRDNFIQLAEEGFYEDLLFHRVINGFMIQGGDPQSKGAAAGAPLGSGGPGYKVEAEMKSNNVHFKGALAAARQGGPVNPKRKSSGSQFYIVQGKEVSDRMLSSQEAKFGFQYTPEQKAKYQEVGGTPFLDMDYTVFGQVVKGLDVIDKIASVGTNRANRPNVDVKILSLRVIK